MSSYTQTILSFVRKLGFLLLVLLVLYGRLRNAVVSYHGGSHERVKSVIHPGFSSTCLTGALPQPFQKALRVVHERHFDL